MRRFLAGIACGVTLAGLPGVKEMSNDEFYKVVSAGMRRAVPGSRTVTVLPDGNILIPGKDVDVVYYPTGARKVFANKKDDSIDARCASSMWRLTAVQNTTLVCMGLQ
jgi:hypothetical protein